MISIQRYINYRLSLSASLSLFVLLIVRYGYHISKNSYFICHDQDVIRSLFERLRNYSGKKDSYPTECGRFSISAVRDLTTGYDSNQPDNKAVSNHMDTCATIFAVFVPCTIFFVQCFEYSMNVILSPNRYNYENNQNYDNNKMALLEVFKFVELFCVQSPFPFGVTFTFHKQVFANSG